MSKYDLSDAQAKQLSSSVLHQLHSFVSPLLTSLDAVIDSRLVRTLVDTLAAILVFRNRAMGLLLSELGSYVASPQHAPAGTKRLSNLLRSPKWSADMIAAFLWQRADERVTQLRNDGEPVLVLWDESVVEKPESLAAEGLCAVRSSHAKRLTRIKPGFFNPPTLRPIFVPGLKWLSLLVIGLSGPPCVAAMRWFTSRGDEGVQTQTARQVERDLLKQCVRSWAGQTILHVFDRGFAGGPWLAELAAAETHFVMRWPKKGYKLIGGVNGEKSFAWQITRGKRTIDSRMIRDAHTRQERKLGVYWTAVEHPDLPNRVYWLVVARSGKAGQEPWYLLTSQPIRSANDAWFAVMAYARRWQIEMCFRYNKSELALQSPRLWTWERRIRLMMIVTLAYAFLITLLNPAMEIIRNQLLQHFCPRTGKRSRHTPAPLYRIRTAISQLWSVYPNPKPLTQNSG